MSAANTAIKRAFKVKKEDDDEGPKAKRARVDSLQTQLDLALRVKEHVPNSPRRSDRLLCSKPAQVSIPLDVGVAERESEDCKVHVDENGVIYDVTLSQTDMRQGKNVNKFCRMQILEMPKTFETYEMPKQQLPFVFPYKLWIRGGRIGGKNNMKAIGCKSEEAAVGEFEKRFENLTGNKWADRGEDSDAGYYALIDMTYETSADSEEQAATPVKRKKKASSGAQKDSTSVKVSKPGEELMAFIFDWKTFEETMSTLNYDASSMPLGKLSETNITAGFRLLSKIADHIADLSKTKIRDRSKTEDMITNLSCQYWSRVPRKFGKQAPPRIDHPRLIKHEVGALRSLVNMQEGMRLMEKAEQVEKAETTRYQAAIQRLDLKEMVAIDRKSKEFEEIHDYLRYSRGKTHPYKYDVEEIFRIQRRQESSRLSSYLWGQRSDRRLLWHGSRSANFGGILSEGLRIAPVEAPSTGLMFGNGIYFADMSSKSAQYCCHELSGDTGLLLLCEVDLKSQVLDLFNADYSAHKRVRDLGIQAVRGVGQTKASVWKDASCVHPDLIGVRMPCVRGLDDDWEYDPRGVLFYDEYVVYSVEQVRLRYLIRTKIWKDWGM